jgi:hypothetical protein
MLERLIVTGIVSVSAGPCFMHSRLSLETLRPSGQERDATAESGSRQSTSTGRGPDLPGARLGALAAGDMPGLTA